MRKALFGLALAALVGACAAPPRGAVSAEPVLWITFGGVPADADLPSLDSRAATWMGTAVTASSDPQAAIASLLTGADVWHHGLWSSSLPESVVLPTLAQALAAHGYRSTAFVPRELQGPSLGLTAGFDRVEPVPPIARLVRAVETLAEGEMLWVHLPDADFARAAREVEIPLSRLLIYADPEIALPPEMRREMERVARRRIAQLDHKLGRLLEAAPSRTLILATGSHGLEMGEHGQVLSGENLGREAIEVPCWIRLPGGEPFAVRPGGRIAQTRLWSTFATRLGLVPPPLLDAGLQRPARRPMLSELFLGNGVNRFSLLEGDLQLLLDVPFAPAESEYYLAKQVLAGGRREMRESGAVLFTRLREAFRRIPPLRGDPALRPPQARLVRWTPDGVEKIEDAEIESRMVVELARRRGRFLVRERAPVDELRNRTAWMPTSAAVP